MLDTEKLRLLQILKSELLILENGGYSKSPRHPWRSHMLFEDSLACNDILEKRESCQDCILRSVIPERAQDYPLPCRHIPITASGEPLDHLYRYANQQEVEDAVKIWLTENIRRLEEIPM